MRGIILCVGGILDVSRYDRLANYLTCPAASAQAYEMSRKYTFAPMGEVHRYIPKDISTERTVESGDAKFGLVVIEDFNIREIEPSIEPADWGTSVSFMDRTYSGLERAKDLAAQWTRYGAVLIASEKPSEAEIEKAWKQRRDYAIARVDEVTLGQTLRRQGTKGYKQGADRSDEMWANEFSLPFAHSLRDTMQGQPQKAEVECPMCFEQIDVRATKCRHCNSTFQKQSVGEYLATREGKADENESQNLPTAAGVRG